MTDRYSEKTLRFWRRTGFPYRRTRHVFITKSMYEGSWDESRQCMHGFGYYKYADGSSYRGYFKNGQYDGYGCMEMVAPHSAILKGTFKNGELVDIEDFRFCDELLMPQDFNDIDEGCPDWLYCCSKDRRFLWEIVTGLKASGPAAMTTQQLVDRKLKAGEYDIEEGVFNTTSGFVTHRPLPYRATSFVPCTENAVKWIKNNCRSGRAKGEILEPTEDYCRKIIETNLEARKWCNNMFGNITTINQKLDHKYFLKLYKNELDKASKFMDDSYEAHDHPCSEKGSINCSSFSDMKITEHFIRKEKQAQEKLKSEYNKNDSIDVAVPTLLEQLYGTKIVPKNKFSPHYFS